MYKHKLIISSLKTWNLCKQNFRNFKTFKAVAEREKLQQGWVERKILISRKEYRDYCYYTYYSIMQMKNITC